MVPAQHKKNFVHLLPAAIPVTAMLHKFSSAQLNLVVRTLLAILYAVAGILHIALPAPFLSITPHWVPWPATVIFITGVCEIAGSIGLFVPRFQKAAGLALACYAVAVFPANINHAMQDMSLASPVLGLWYHIPRLALQPILVWAALYATNDMHKD